MKEAFPKPKIIFETSDQEHFDKGWSTKIAQGQSVFVEDVEIRLKKIVDSHCAIISCLWNFTTLEIPLVFDKIYSIAKYQTFFFAEPMTQQRTNRDGTIREFPALAFLFKAPRYIKLETSAQRRIKPKRMYIQEL